MRVWWIGLVVAALVTGCSGSDATSGETASVNTASPGAPNAAGAGSAPASDTTAGPVKLAEEKYQTLSSGVKYAVLQEGSGPAAGHQEVHVHYTGWLENGTKFDSSRGRGEPFAFVLGHGDVIKGWDEGVKGMKVGEKRQLVIPSDLGYGASGTPDGSIPPNSTLIFEVELMRMGDAHSH